MMKMKRHSSFRLIGALGCLAAGLAGCDQRSPLAPSASTDGLAPLAAGAAGGLGAPSSLTSTAASKSQVNLTWADNSDNETGFEVQRSTAGGTFTVLTTTGANVTAHSDSVGLTPLTHYCYTVRALRTTGKTTHYSAFSNTSCAKTPGPPPAASNTDARPASSSAVVVTWGDNSLTEDGFRVERSLDGGASWAAVATTAANVTSLQDGGRSSEQPVCYRVVAFNAHGDSGPSNADCTAPPAGPTSLTAATAAGTGVNLTWADNSGAEDGYEVQRSEDGVTFGTIANLAANAASYHDAGATSSTTTYWYRVRAKKDSGFSDPSNVASAQGGCGPLGATEICDNGVTDDDCDGLPEWSDPDCQDQHIDCGVGCPGRYVCDVGTGFCVPHCDDGAWNGDEADRDCGGACDAKCQNGQRCNGNFDCASGKCVGGRCQP